jgi:LuxR family maltose regulon positive regulatory protein
MAIHYFSQALESTYLMLRRADADCMAGLALAYQATQQTDKATATLERLYEFIHPFDDLTLSGIAHSCRARLSLMRGETAFVSDVLSINIAPQTDAMAIWLEVPAITRCRALLAKGSDNCLQEAEKKLQELLSLNQAHHNTCQMIGIMALQALAIHRQGRSDESLDALEQAVAMAEPAGWIRPFVEPGPPMVDLLKGLLKRNVAVNYIEKILSAFKDDKQVVGPKAADHPIASAHQPLRPSITSQSLVEQLTHRELDVLELLAQRLQNKEIADKLFISPGTVKGHLKSIYQKLNVSNRRQAVEKAHTLDIIKRR